MDPQPSEPYFRLFAQAATIACLFELKMRLLADNTAELQKYKDEQLEALVKRVTEHMQNLIVSEEAVLLKKCARIRNKLLHADFSKAAGTLLSVGINLEQGKVHLIDLVDGSVRKISDSNTSDGRVYGWLLEGARSGAFEQAGKLFIRGIALVGWMLAQV